MVRGLLAWLMAWPPFRRGVARGAAASGRALKKAGVDCSYSPPDGGDGGPAISPQTSDDIR